MKLMLVEDEESTAELLSTTLMAERYTVDIARDEATSFNWVTQQEYDMVLLSTLIPEFDVSSVCQHFRSLGYQMPILLLLPKHSTQEIVAGLDAGADDYLTKPVNLSFMLAKIRALLRRTQTNPSHSLLVWGKLTLDRVALKVTYNQQEIKLKAREYKLLELLMRNPRRVFSRNTIIDQIWTNNCYPTQGAVTNLVKDIRQQFKKAGIVEEVIETVFGLGYRMQASSETKVETSWQQQESASAAIAPTSKWSEALWEAPMQVLTQIEPALSTHELTPEQQATVRAKGHQLCQLMEELRIFLKHPHQIPSRPLMEDLLTQDSPSQLSKMPALSQQCRSCWQPPLQPDVKPSAIVTGNELHTAANQRKSSHSHGSVIFSPTESSQAIALFVGDRATSKSIKQVLTPWGIRVFTITNPQALWNTFITVSPHLLLLDLDIYPSDHIELCRELITTPDYQEIPILVLTEQTDPAYLKQLLATGINDFINQPIVGSEVVSRVVNCLEVGAIRKQWQLQRSHSRKLQQTHLDPLTQLPNRYLFECHLQQVWQELSEKQEPIVLILSEIDDFQRHLSGSGYAVGNDGVQQIAQTLQQCIGMSGSVARYGTAAFAILLPATPLDTALRLTQKIQQQMTELNTHQRLGVSESLTMSMGIVGIVPTTNQMVKALIKAATQALSTAQRQGRNTYCLYSL